MCLVKRKEKEKRYTRIDAKHPRRIFIIISKIVPILILFFSFWLYKINEDIGYTRTTRMTIVRGIISGGNIQGIVSR